MRLFASETVSVLEISSYAMIPTSIKNLPETGRSDLARDQLVLNDSFLRADGSACSTSEACICVDDVDWIAFADCRNWALAGTCAASNTRVCDLICHSLSPLIKINYIIRSCGLEVNVVYLFHFTCKLG